MGDLKNIFEKIHDILKFDISDDKKILQQKYNDFITIYKNNQNLISENKEVFDKEIQEMHIRVSALNNILVWKSRNYADYEICVNCSS